MNEKKKQQFNMTMLWAGFLASLIVVNCIFVYLISNDLNTIILIKNELNILNQQKRIIAAATDINQKYKSEISVISRVFPNEQTIPAFIQSMEAVIKSSSFEFNPIRFNSLTPVVEGDKLYLLMTVNMNTDLVKLSEFLSKIEKMPYMTHITGISAKTPGGFSGKGEIIIGMKIYVQNPFIIE